MKKIAAIFLAAVGLAVLFAFGGCSGEEVFTEREYSSGDALVKSVSVDAEDREVSVIVSEDWQVHVSGWESEKEYYEIDLSQEGALTVTLRYNKEWTDFIGTKPSAQYRKIVLAVPDQILSSLTVTTTNETIALGALSFAESVSLDSNGGDVRFERVSVGKSLCVTAKNGDIDGSVIGGWDDFSIACEIKKGDSNLPASKEGGQKSLTANCNNGDIHIEFVAA